MSGPRLLTCGLLALGLHLLTAYATAATDLSGTVAADTTLTASGNPYNLVGPLVINAGVRLTLQAGVAIIAQGSHRIYVNGALQADGTVTKPIVLRAKDSGSRGAWEGIYVSAGGQCLLNHVTVKNAVTNLTAVGADLQLQGCNLLQGQEDGLMAWGSTVLQATGCHFGSNGRRGLYLEGDEATGAVAGCQFRLNGDYPVYLKATLAEMLQSGNAYAGNGIQRVGVSSSLVSDIADEDTWVFQGLDFDTSAGAGDSILTIAATGQLTMARGVRVRSAGMQVYGTLRVFGAETLGCALLSPAAAPAPGDWAGLTFRPGSSADLNWLDLAHATTGVTADGAEVRLTDSVVRDCEYDGLRATGGATVYARFDRFLRCGRNGVRLDGPDLAGVVKGCVFKGQGAYPLWALAANVSLVRNLNSYSDNGVQAIGVSCSQDPDLVSGTHAWIAQGIPVDCAADGLGTVLNIGPGATLVLKPDLVLLSGGVINRGHLEVSGTSSRRVHLLPPTTDPAPGDWAGLTFSNATGLISGACVEWAATGITLSGSSPPISETLVRGCEYDALRCQGSSSPVVTTSQFGANGRHGVLIENTANPNLGDLASAIMTDDGRNRFGGNGGYDLYNATTNTIAAQSNWWPSADTAAIQARIYDQADDSRYGPVSFTPYAGADPNSAPVLSWTGAAGYENDGLNPEVGAPSTLFRFRVRYSDAEGTPPSAMVLHVAASDSEVAGSPFAMDRGSQTNYAAGVTYLRNLTLATGRAYTYWFAASDGDLAAVGVPTAARTGPLVNTAPVLEWAGTAGWTADGVAPDAGVAGTTVFRFRAGYRDADDDPPTSVLCHLALGGAPVAGSPFVMQKVQGTTYRQGMLYEHASALTSAGAYEYRFEASDGVEQASGTPTAATSGPQVSVGDSLALLRSVAARQTPGGMVELRWHLTAPASVSVGVTNMAGRPVAAILDTKPYGAGPGSVTWSGRAKHGVRVPTGVYLVTVESASGDGQRQRQLLPIVVNR